MLRCVTGERTAFAGDLAVGEAVRVRGRYVAHWEWSRFELVRRRRVLPDQRLLCALEPRKGVAPSVFEAAGIVVPRNWRGQRGLPFDVTAIVTPLERGHFGHLGTLTWRLRVEEWIRVVLLLPPAHR